MTIVDRYVLKQVSRPLTVALVVGLLMLLAERFVRILDLTLGKKGSLSIVFEMLGYLAPHYLGLAIPGAIFVGLLFGFNQLSRNAEIDAFLAAGISLHRLARPVILLSVTAALLAVYIFGWLQPYTRYAYRALKHAVQDVDTFYLAEEGVFMTAGKRTFILDRLDRRNRRFQRIFLFTDQGTDGSETVTARSGFLVAQQNDPRPLLVLENGHRLRVFGWPFSAPADALPKFETSLFNHAETIIGKERVAGFRPRGGNARELTMTELFTTLRRPLPPGKQRQLRAELHKRLVSILTLPLLPFLAIPFAVGQRRKQRAYRFALALAILVFYHEAVQQGSIAVKTGVLNVWVGIWLPWFLLAVFAFARYYRTCFTLRRDIFESFYDLASRIGDFVREWLPWRRKKKEARS